MWKTVQKIKNINGLVNKTNFINTVQHKPRSFSTVLDRKQVKCFTNNFKS